MVMELARFNRPETGRGANLMAAPLLLDVVLAIEPCLALLPVETEDRPRSEVELFSHVEPLVEV